MTCDRLTRWALWLPIVGVSALLVSPNLTMAAAIGGSAVLDNGNGTVLVSGNGVTSGCIIWSSGNNPPPPACPTSGAGTFTVEPGSTNPPFTTGTNGTIDNLNFNSLAGGPLVGFMVVDGVDFDLTGIAVNTGATIGECSPVLVGGLNWDSPGATCIPAGSPFELQNGLATGSNGQANTVSVTFSVYAEAYTGSSGVHYNAATPYIGVFTTQSANGSGTPLIAGNIDSVLTAIQSGSGITASWSANFSPSATTPEPATMLFCGGGLILLALITKRYKTRGEDRGKSPDSIS